MTPWTAAHQAPPSLRFSRQEYWSGVPSPSPRNTVLHTLNIFLQPAQQPCEVTLSISGNWGSERLSKFLKVLVLRSNGESMAHPLNPNLCCLPENFTWLFGKSIMLQLTLEHHGFEWHTSTCINTWLFFSRFVVCYYTIRVGWIHRCETWDMGGWPRSYPQNLGCVDVRPPMSLLFKGQLYFLKCFITIGLAKKFIQVFLYDDMGETRTSFLAKPV